MIGVFAQKFTQANCSFRWIPDSSYHQKLQVSALEAAISLRLGLSPAVSGKSLLKCQTEQQKTGRR